MFDGRQNVLAGIVAFPECFNQANTIASRVDDLEESFIRPFVAAHGGITCDAGDYCEPGCSPRDSDCPEASTCGDDGICAEDCNAPDNDCSAPPDPVDAGCGAAPPPGLVVLAALLFLRRRTRA
jgi:uncharacterized protein (TIGR03382 family)